MWWNYFRLIQMSLLASVKNLFYPQIYHDWLIGLIMVRTCVLNKDLVLVFFCSHTLLYFMNYMTSHLHCSRAISKHSAAMPQMGWPRHATGRISTAVSSGWSSRVNKFIGRRAMSLCTGPSVGLHLASPAAVFTKRLRTCKAHLRTEFYVSNESELVFFRPIPHSK